MRHIISILLVLVLMLMTSCRRQTTDLYEASWADTIVMTDTIRVVQAQYDTVYMKHQEVTDMKITILEPQDSGELAPVKQIIVEKNQMTEASAKHEHKKEDAVEQKTEIKNNGQNAEVMVVANGHPPLGFWCIVMIVIPICVCMLYFLWIKK